ncbi:FecR domain-containing protein [Sphingobacterium sp. UT-1RO-CII-1]|uniref:FecR family protein n=1 Tax=Sphingobacterium sp. UT-1RO-CII-1 TaxID=2995225 RepID=UPI00227B18DF|nr:FecR family protein [Sphingobacterium sp. UT-1RO-CII-1]MCY4780148.1 FecR domain-containing protein [Sphingobacterium sp. UT-1RO-CII-1]
MNQVRLKYLMSKYVDNTISKSELAEFLAGLSDIEVDDVAELVDFEAEELDALFNNEDYVLAGDKNFLEKLKDEEVVSKNKRHVIFTYKFSLAIVAALLLVVGCFFYQMQSSTLAGKLVQADISLPEDNQATVTLQNGKSYSLLHTSEDVLAEEGLQLVKTTNGELFFKVVETSEEHVVYRTFNSPKGVSSKIVLSDETVVLLNSGASLTYPSRFSAEHREVAIIGEAFFDVTHRDQHPFLVKVDNTLIKVLGTTFNIATDAVANKVLTTLVSGSVEVFTPKARGLIKPGMQSVSDQISGELQHKSVEIQDVLAWKEGYFRFNEDDIRSVLNKIKSWYAIEEFEILAITNDRFTGAVKRTQKLSELLEQLEKISSYKFKIIEGRVIVMY